MTFRETSTPLPISACMESCSPILPHCVMNWSKLGCWIRLLESSHGSRRSPYREPHLGLSQTGYYEVVTADSEGNLIEISAASEVGVSGLPTPTQWYREAWK